MRCAALAFFLFAAVSPAAQQPPPQASSNAATESVGGRVVAASNGAALPRVRMELFARGRRIANTLTDERGRFTLLVSDDAPLTLTAAKAGHAPLSMELSRATLTGAAGDLRIGLVASTAIAGRVMEPSGVPALGAWVIAVPVTGDARDAAGAERRFEIDTDDLGDYRLSSLPAGRYAVRAGWTPVTTATPAPGDAAGATLVILAPGDEAAGVDFVVDARPIPSSPLFPAAQNGKGIIRGRVADPSGRPIAGGMVMASQPGTFPLPAGTDAQGRFTIIGLRAGAYTVQARSPGHASRQYGQEGTRLSGRAVDLRDGETVQGIDIVLPRGGAIAGTIVDEAGEPVQGLNVRALELRYAGGRMEASGTSLTERRSDDRGRYRIFGLDPGTYLLSASIDGNGYAPIYYPGTPNIGETSRVQIELGRDAAGIDFVFASHPSMPLMGTALDSTGRPLRGFVVLVRSRHSSVGTAPSRVGVGTDGVFLINNVPSGNYVLQATRQTPDDLPEFAAQPVTITDAPPAPLSITTSPGAMITGRLVIEGQPELPSGLGLIPVPADLDYAPAIVDSYRFVTLEDGTFHLSGLNGRRRLRLGRAPEDWYLKSVIINGQEATDSPFDFGFREAAYEAQVVISRAGATIDGRVTDDRARAIADCTVIVFSTDRENWVGDSRHLRMARSGTDGSFRVRALTPGNYLVAAVMDGTVAGAEWHNPEILEKLSAHASRVTVGEGESHSITIRPSGTAVLAPGR